MVLLRHLLTQENIYVILEYGENDAPYIFDGFYSKHKKRDYYSPYFESILELFVNMTFL